MASGRTLPEALAALDALIADPGCGATPVRPGRPAVVADPEVAAWLQVPLSTLRIWRHRREGPPAVKVGRLLRYSRRDLETWIESRRQESVARAR